MGKVKKRNEQAAQMARVEQQIKIAQKEAVWARGQGRVKKTFSHETPADSVEEVPSSSPYLCRPAHIICSRTDTSNFRRGPLGIPFQR